MEVGWWLVVGDPSGKFAKDENKNEIYFFLETARTFQKDLQPPTSNRLDEFLAKAKVPVDRVLIHLLRTRREPYPRHPTADAFWETQIFSQAMVKMSRVCPKCGKDFSTNPYWSTDLPRHLARKNPCDRPADWKFVRSAPGDVAPPPRSPLRCLDSVEWAEPVPPKPDLPMRLVAPWFFKQIVKDPANVCFVRPNRSKNEVWVKETKDAPVRIVRLDEFIRLFVNLVMRKHFLRDYDGFGTYDAWLFGENFINLDEEWDGSFPDEKPEFMFGMRDVLTEVLSTWPGKTPLKNMLLNFV